MDGQTNLPTANSVRRICFDGMDSLRAQTFFMGQLRQLRLSPSFTPLFASPFVALLSHQLFGNFNNSIENAPDQFRIVRQRCVVRECDSF